MSNANMIAALLRERAGYEARGLADRVALVNEQLAYYGHAPEGPVVPAGRSAADEQQQNAAADTGEDGKRGRGRPKLPRDAAGNIVRG